jgi:2-polyprenyl-3-methyl-5-hydroxy-6-metoxy-1,4-benzoquinol methylase
MSANAATDPYAKKPPHYFTGGRPDFVAMLPDNPTASILEIGCGAGETGALAIAAGKCRRYAGVELMPDVAEKARLVSPEIITGDIERMDLNFADQSFDAVILSEVLEHLAWPDKVLQKIGPKLKPGALVLASSPNIAHWKIARDLIRGRFDPSDIGVMDRTHLRWFTPTTYAAMFTAAGYRVERLWPVRPLKGSKKLLASVTGKPSLFWVQICLSARWNG